ncbi:MAG: carboxypeptidase regulatory-like domain-containing protein, partial [Bacteroidota bacterium]
MYHPMNPLRSLCLVLILTTATYVTTSAQFTTPIIKANKQYELHAYNLAIQTYLLSLDRRPNNLDAIAKLADCYFYTNQMEQAESRYREWIEKSKQQRKSFVSEPLLRLGKTLIALARYDEAKEVLRAYQQKDPAESNRLSQACDFAKTQLGVPSSYLVSNEFINSPSAEFGAAFLGNQVAFSSARTDIQRTSAGWTGKAYNQLFRSRLGANEFLDPPVFLKSGLENEYNVGPLAFAPNGEYVVYTKNNFTDGTRQIPSAGMELSLHIAQISSTGQWVNSRPYAYNGTDYSTGFPTISQDGETMYFASDRPDGFGGFDIYVSYRMGNTWSAPENLGPIVNTPGNELSPYFHNQTLYFSSDWHPGFGGFDVFRAERTNGRFLKIYHLGNAVNSPRDDYGFIFDDFKNIGYVTSNRPGGKGNEDIYKVFRSADNIVIRVKNASDGQPLEAAIVDFSSCGEQAFQTDASGLYSFQAVQGLNCRVVIRKEGYLSSTLQVSTVGLNNSRRLEVSLTRLGEEYPGKVVSALNGASIAGVKVIAANLRTQSTVETSTDMNGDYALALSPNTPYSIRFSRPGFLEANMNVQTGDGRNRSILNIARITPTTTTGTPPVDPNPGTTPVTPSPGVGAGYAIQVAAIGSPMLQSFSDLEPYGQVYYKQEGGRYKIRVGVFDSRDRASAVLNSVKRQGYRGAFIVDEVGQEAEKGGGVTNPPVAGGNSRYKIQLAAYS